MKTTILLFSILSFFLLTSSMCEKEDDSPSSSTSNVSVMLQQGAWKITYYKDSGTEKTVSFSGYSFAFNSNGSIIATNNSNTVNGTWSEGTDDSMNKLYINFSLSPFNELNDDWHILEQSSSKIKLEDVSGGNGGIDYLTFEKL